MTTRSKVATGRKAGASTAAEHDASMRVKVTNPDRVLFPDAALTKGAMIDYYRRVAPRMLPYLMGRPLTLQRFPRGIDAPGFIQQRAARHFPDYVTRVTVEKEGGEITHAVCNNAETLVYLANQGCITPHVWLSRVGRLHHPDRLILDLDPSSDPSGDAFPPVRRAARAARALLDELGLASFVMTTGSSGLHVVVPLVPGTVDFDAARAFARDAATVLARRHPDALTVEQRKDRRTGRVFLDYLRNTYAHTAVPPYAVRALPEAPVATPLAWDELDRDDLHARRYTVANLFDRLARTDDPWAGLEHHAQSLGPARHRLDALLAADGGAQAAL